MPEQPDDLTWGVFADSHPWILDRAEITWLPLVDALREGARNELPALTRPSKLPPGLRVGTVVGRLGWGVVPWLVRKKMGRFSSTEESRTMISKRLRLAAEALGPTYIKLGQIISSGEGLFPTELVEEFKLCRDQVQPEPCRGRREGGRGGPRRPVGGHSRRSTNPAGSGVDRPGPRRHAPHRRAGGRQGPASAGDEPRAQGPARHVVDRPASRRSDPDSGARQPTGARRALRRDNRRGARLPARGRRTCSTS